VSLFDPGEPQHATRGEQEWLIRQETEYFGGLYSEAPRGNFGANWERLGLRGEWTRLANTWLFVGITAAQLEPAPVEDSSAVVDDEYSREQILWGRRIVLAYQPSGDTVPSLEVIRANARVVNPRGTA
jgi:hypothetical protein